MKQVAYILGAPLVFLLAGCVLSGKQTQKVSATPLPPKPASSVPASSTPAPQSPLSIPQTVAELPAPQPISADALATTLKPAEEPVESQPGPRTPPRRGPVAGPPRAEPALPVQAQAPPTPAPPPPTETPVERAPIAEILPAAEVKRLQDSVDTRKRDIRRVLDQTDQRKLDNAQRDLVARIRTLVQQSDEAGARNDWRQADALAGQALVLVRELQGGR
jgi:hypothetical protein